MAITYDTTTEATTGIASSYTWSHTTSASSNAIMVVGVSWYTTAGRTISSVTYNGVNLSFIGTQSRFASQHISLYALASPSSGANNVVVTFSGNVTASAFATTFTDATQNLGDLESTFVSKQQTSASPSLAIVSSYPANCAKFGFLSSGGNPTVAGGATQVSEEFASGAFYSNAHYEIIAAGADSVAWTISSSYSNALTGILIPEYGGGRRRYRTI